MLRAVFVALGSIFLIPIISLADEVIIKPGETLSEIADKYKVSITTLRRLNDIDDEDGVF